MTNEEENVIFYCNFAVTEQKGTEQLSFQELNQKQQSHSWDIRKDVGSFMDSDSCPLVGAVILGILLIMNFILAVVGAALQNTGDAELEEAFEAAGKDSDLMASLKNTPSRLIHAIWLFESLTCVCIGWGVMPLSRQYPVWAVVPLLILLVYLLNNSIPSMLGRKNSARWLIRCQKMVRIFLTLASPFTYVLTVLSNCCVRLMGIDPAALDNEVTEDEIISMVNEGHEQGVLDASEAEMIQNIFELDDKEAQDIMTHRKNIIGISSTVNLRDALSFMVGETVSRFPVYEESIDNILGILHFKDAMKFHTMEQYDDWLVKDIPGLLRESRYIPETRSISVLFKNMQASKLQMVLVVDEYGQTAGLVTMEDILEEIVGNIQDEYDNDVQFIRSGPGGSLLMDGMTPLSEAGEALGVAFEEEYDTLNGFLISRLDRIPADGEQISLQEYGYLFRILEVENKMVRKVQITKSEEMKEKEEKEEERE